MDQLVKHLLYLSYFVVCYHISIIYLSSSICREAQLMKTVCPKTCCSIQSPVHFNHNTTHHWTQWVICHVFPEQSHKALMDRTTEKSGPTEIWTRIAGFRVQSANHYTMAPLDTWKTPMLSAVLLSLYKIHKVLCLIAGLNELTSRCCQNQLYWPCMRTHTSNLTPVFLLLSTYRHKQINKQKTCTT